jgi:hypothetical protein
MGDPLEAIDRLVRWESFRADIEAVVLTPGRAQEKQRRPEAVRCHPDVQDAGVAGAQQSVGRAGAHSSCMLRLSECLRQSSRGRVVVDERAAEPFGRGDKACGHVLAKQRNIGGVRAVVNTSRCRCRWICHDNGVRYRRRRLPGG